MSEREHLFKLGISPNARIISRANGGWAFANMRWAIKDQLQVLLDSLPRLARSVAALALKCRRYGCPTLYCLQYQAWSRQPCLGTSREAKLEHARDVLRQYRPWRPLRKILGKSSGEFTRFSKSFADCLSPANS
jgi:hypothetical protein